MAAPYVTIGACRRHVDAIPIERLTRLLDGERAARFRASADRGSALLTGTTVWNINATVTGGGVAEMLQSQRVAATQSQICTSACS